MISVKNLSFTYPNSDSFALSDINFDIASGEVFGFLGPSGAGKSTAQKILYKILDNYQGEILVDGKDLKDIGIEYKSKIGVGFELPNHYEKLTTAENLNYFGSFYDPAKLLDIDYLLTKVGLIDDKNKRVEDFSKGMKMRLNFVRAIQHDPEIVFLDEPTAGLDPANGSIVKQMIKDMRDKGKTIFLTTHNMYTADELCDRVAFIVEGKLMKIGQPEELKSAFGSKNILVTFNDSDSKEFPLLNIADNRAFITAIADKDLKGIHTQEATLEEVFLQVTGKRLT